MGAQWARIGRVMGARWACDGRTMGAHWALLGSCRAVCPPEPFPVLHTAERHRLRHCGVRLAEDVVGPAPAD